MKKIAILSLVFGLLLLSICQGRAAPVLGDLNGDGEVNLDDAIQALQVTTHPDRMEHSGASSHIDINFDTKTGLEDALFILQAVAGQRETTIATRDTAATVVLPEGFGLPLSSLVVYGQLGNAAVGGTGSFTLPFAGTGDALVVVANGVGTPLILGWLEAAGNDTVVGVQSTAVALLFQAMGAYTLPKSAWSQARALIAATPQATTLANTITERLIVDPEALAKGDPAVAAAVNTAVEAIFASRSVASAPSLALATLPPSGRSVAPAPSLAPATLPPSGRSGMQMASVPDLTLVTMASVGETPGVTHVKIDGNNPVSGVYLEPAPEGNGIIARNDFRRHVLVLVYLTGYEDTSGVTHHTPWKLAVQGPFEPLASGAYLMATTAVGGVVSSLFDLLWGNIVYAPTVTELIPLPMFPGVDPTTLAKTFYHVVAVGDSEAIMPAVPENLLAVAGDVETARMTMRALEFFKEFLLPVLFAIIPSDDLAVDHGISKEYLAAAIDYINLISQSVPDVATYYAAGLYKNAAIAALKALVSNPTLLKKSGELIARAGIIKGWNAATEGGLSAGAQKAMALLAIADKVVAGFDTLVLMVHLRNSQAYEQWDATVLWPPVRVQPKPATVEVGKDVQLIVTVGGETGNSDKYFYKFSWTTTGVHGKLVNPDGSTPPGTQVTMTSRLPGARVNYESDALAEPGDEDAVTVLVTRVSVETGEAKLGEDQTTVTVSGSHVDLEPSTANVDLGGSQAFMATVAPPPAEGDTYYFEWTNSAEYGHLAGGRDEFESTEATGVVYQADRLDGAVAAGADKGGVDSVSLSVYRERAGKRDLLGMASAMVNVRQQFGVQLTPSGQALSPGASQTFTATLVPALEGATLVYTWDNTATAGHLTGTGASDHYETAQNQATYTAGQDYGTDTLTVKVERVINGERFPLADAASPVTVGNFIVSLPTTLTVDQGKWITVSADVTPAEPTDGYYKWTRTGLKGQLIDYNSGQTDSFETANSFAKYQANSDVTTGADIVRVELYVNRNGKPILLGSAEGKVLVKGQPVLVNHALRWQTAEAAEGACGEGYGYPWYRMYGMLSLSWQPVSDFTPSGYFIQIDTKGNDLGTNGRGYSPGVINNVNGDISVTSCEPCDVPFCTVRAGTIPSGSMGVTVKMTMADWNKYYEGVNGPLDQYFANRVQSMSDAAGVAAGWTIQVWAKP